MTTTNGSFGPYVPGETGYGFLYHEWVGLARVLTPRRSIALLAALVVLVLTGSALAADPGLVDQYVEDIPTAGGTHHSGGSAGPTGSGGSTAGPTTGSATLTPAVEDDLKAAGKDGEKLKEVATSARYGAPATAQAQGGAELGAPSATRCGCFRGRRRRRAHGRASNRPGRDHGCGRRCRCHRAPSQRLAREVLLHVVRLHVVADEDDVVPARRA